MQGVLRMSELECWLGQIAERPDDHVTRAVFADWLEEREYPQAPAVRASRDAMECLLEFPALDEKVVCGDRFSPTQYAQTGYFQAGPQLRPVWRLSGFSSWVISHCNLYFDATRTQTQVLVTQKVGSTHIPAINWQSVVVSGVGFPGTDAYKAANFTLSLSADPPSLVRWSVGVQVWGN